MGSSMLKDFEEVKIAQFDFSIFSESLRYLHAHSQCHQNFIGGGGRPLLWEDWGHAPPENNLILFL